MFQHRRCSDKVDSVEFHHDPGNPQYFSFMLIASYMVITKRKFVWNKTVLFGAVCNTVMALTFVSATKMTTAANAIVLQFTEPIFVILLMWALYKKKPKKRQWWHVRSCLPVSYASF